MKACSPCKQAKSNELFCHNAIFSILRYNIVDGAQKIIITVQHVEIYNP